MPNFSTNEFKPGLKVMLDNEPCSILENEYVKPGKGRRLTESSCATFAPAVFWRRPLSQVIRSRALTCWTLISSTPTPTASFGTSWTNTFEQHSADKAAVADAEKWLKEQEKFEVTLFNGAPLTVTPPNFIELEITETDPGLKGHCARWK